MKITIENVAIIEKADIELNGMTVVAGLNKTGKTTIGKALYAIICAYKNLPRRILNARRNGIQNAILSVLRKNKKLMQEMFVWEMVEDFEENIQNKDLLEWLSDESRNKFREYIDDWYKSKEKYSKYIQPEMLDDLFREICVILNRSDDEYQKYLLESYFANVFKKQVSCFYNDWNGEIRFDFQGDSIDVCFSGDELVDFTPNLACETQAIYIESYNLLDLYYALNRSNRVMRNARRFSVPSEECLKMLRKVVNQEDPSYEEYAEAKKIKGIIEYITNKVTHGALKNDSSGICFVDQRSEQTIELSNLSAGLKIFVVIQTLLENGSLKEGDILLIDEPEVNLHPEWQIALAEVLVLLRKELGLIIYINSHSPYFIRAIEVKMAENDIALEGRFYLTKEGKDGLCSVKNVSESPEEIYRLLYKPLEKL